MTEDQKIEAARKIAHRLRTHRETCAEIIRQGLAEDVAEADELLYEVDRLESYRSR